jgi:hypothetical protein
MSKKVFRRLTILGMVAVAAYILHVVLGGILWNGYNHLMQPISDLTATGAPDRALLQTILWFYAFPAILFGLCAYLYLRSFAPKVAQAGMLLYLIMQIVSFSYNFFPEDLAGSPATFLGTMHLAVTSLIIPLTILAPILIGAGFRRLEGFKGFGTYSIVTGILIFIFGGTTAMFFALQLPYFGTVERLNIGTLQVWTFLTALKLLRTDTSGMGKWVRPARN